MRYYLPADGSLDSDLELLPWDFLLQPFTDNTASLLCIALEHKLGKSIDTVSIDKYIHSHEFRGLVSDDIVIKGCITAGYGLEPVIEIKEDLCQRHLIDKLDTLLVKIVHARLDTALLKAESDYRADILRRGDYIRLDLWLFRGLDAHRLRILQGIVDLDCLPISHVDDISYRGRSEDY